MVMDRRGFLAAMLATGIAPAIVRSESLMRIVVPKIYVPPAPLLTLQMIAEEALHILSVNIEKGYFVRLPTGDRKFIVLEKLPTRHLSLQ